MSTEAVTANSYQVGGNHYDSVYKHWDLCVNINAGYLEGQETKYLARFRKAGKPLQDLGKSKHYVEKLLESSQIVSTVGRRPRHWVQQETGLFCRANDIVGRHRHLFFVILNWNTKADLIIAGGIIQEFIDTPSCWTEAVAPLTSDVVPLEDSNRHADRA